MFPEDELAVIDHDAIELEVEITPTSVVNVSGTYNVLIEWIDSDINYIPARLSSLDIDEHTSSARIHVPSGTIGVRFGGIDIAGLTFTSSSHATFTISGVHLVFDSIH